jgi:hypothetical protein
MSSTFIEELLVYVDGEAVVFLDARGSILLTALPTLGASQRGQRRVSEETCDVKANNKSINNVN